MKFYPLPKRDAQIAELIKNTNSKVLARWAIDCLERILPLFEEKYPNEKIPRTAVNTLKSWINDEITMWEARKYCYVVLKLARDLESVDKASCQIVRATSHCLATCHVKTHSEGTSIYVRSALQYLYPNDIELLDSEKKWHINHLIELSSRSNL